jgi:hypothetical protein
MVTNRELTTLDGVEVFYLPIRAEFGTTPDRVGGGPESSVLTIPGRTACRVAGTLVVFERPGLREEIDMSHSRAEIERRFLGWTICFPVLNGNSFPLHPNRLPRHKGRLLRRPRIAGFDPRLTVGAFVLVVLTGGANVFLGVAPMVFLIWCAYQSRRRAIEIGLFLNDLSPLLPDKKSRRLKARTD